MRQACPGHWPQTSPRSRMIRTSYLHQAESKSLLSATGDSSSRRSRAPNAISWAPCLGFPQLRASLDRPLACTTLGLAWHQQSCPLPLTPSLSAAPRPLIHSTDVAGWPPSLSHHPANDSPTPGQSSREGGAADLCPLLWSYFGQHFSCHITGASAWTRWLAPDPASPEDWNSFVEGQAMQWLCCSWFPLWERG